jgi:hypothetical protein
MPEVDQQSELVTGGIQVIEELRSMLVYNFINRLQLNDDFIEADEIGLVGAFKGLPFVG